MARRPTSLLILTLGGLFLAAVYGYTRTYAPDPHCGAERSFLPERGAIVAGAATRYPPATPPPCARNQHGERESIGSTEVTHWFVEADGIVWHFVTSGDEDEAKHAVRSSSTNAASSPASAITTGDDAAADPRAAPVVLLHGFPQSWWAFHHQIEALATHGYRAIAIDVIPYGQSDKRVDLDYRYPAIAAGVLALLDRIGVDRFSVVAHDRGAVIADHLIAQPGAAGRVERYLRMQEAADRTHADPSPPHRLMGSPAGAFLYQSRRFPSLVYQGQLVARPLPPGEIRRLDYEFKYRGIAEAAPLSFRTTSFDQELLDRRGGLFARMTMPVLFLQGRLDPGQHPDEYFRVAETVAQGRLQFVEAGHFPHLEAPEIVNAAMLEFLGGSAAGESERGDAIAGGGPAAAEEASAAAIASEGEPGAAAAASGY